MDLDSLLDVLSWKPHLHDLGDERGWRGQFGCRLGLCLGGRRGLVNRLLGVSFLQLGFTASTGAGYRRRRALGWSQGFVHLGC